MTHRNSIPRASHAALFAIAATTLSAQAHARIGQLCLELPAGAGVVRAQIASGCLPTSPGHEGAFTINVDPDNATIRVDGNYKPVREQRWATADCMGSQVIEQEAEAAGPRRYSVMVNGRYQGVIDASDTMFGMRAVRECFAGPSQVRIARPERVTIYRREQFDDWIKNATGNAADSWSRPGYSTLGELAGALMGDHPESTEGRPSTRITIAPGQWRGKVYQKPPRVTFMTVRIEEHGLLDDSVSGRRQFATAVRSGKTGNWRITGHWHQFMCARGERAGQWSGEPCS